MSTLTPDIAARFMALTSGHLTREYPHKLDHVLDGPEDAATPSQLHPIFHGSFDWHSCVHGWWQVLRLARLFPDLPEAEAVRQLAARMLTADYLKPVLPIAEAKIQHRVPAPFQRR